MSIQVRLAARWLRAQAAKDASAAHERSIALMKFLSRFAKSLGPRVAQHTYVVGGAVRDFVLDRPIKDIDVVIDAVALGRDSEWFVRRLAQTIPTSTSLETNQYGVAILTIKGSWILDGQDLQGEKIEVANARKESYGGEAGKGYKPSEVEPADIETDTRRRELTYNTLLIRLLDLANGPDKADIIDLTGCGLQDLRDGVMRCPDDPNKVFSDDPSRMIRVIKFALRYGHRLTPDTKAAITRNAPKLRNVPSSHLANLMTDIILKEDTWKPALEMMADLGLLDPVRELLGEDKAFRSTLLNHVNSGRMDMLFGLLDMGIPLGARIDFLGPTEQSRLREITVGMERDDAWDFLEKVRNVGNALQDKRFIPDLAGEFGVPPREMRRFGPVVMGAGRELLLEQPTLAQSPARLKALLRREVERRYL